MDIIKQKRGWMKWNRKIHIYLGLFLLLFIWLFSFSGLLLNHHWEFAEFWKNRNETTYEQSIQISGKKGGKILVHEIKEKLNLNGSISNSSFA